LSSRHSGISLLKKHIGHSDELVQISVESGSFYVAGIIQDYDAGDSSQVRGQK